MSKLSEKKLDEVASTWRWRDRFGNFHHPVEMETRHLFHTISMIWNHVMPIDARTHDYRKYNFSSFYSEHYMRIGVRAILRELLNRNDRTSAMEFRLKFMASYLAKGETIKEITDEPEAFRKNPAQPVSRPSPSLRLPRGGA